MLVRAKHEDVGARRAVPSCATAQPIAVLLVAHATATLVASSYLRIVEKVVIVRLLRVVIGRAHGHRIVRVVRVDALARRRPNILSVAPHAMLVLKYLLLAFQQDLALHVLGLGLVELHGPLAGLVVLVHCKIAFLLRAAVC